MKKILFTVLVLFAANAQATTDKFLEYYIPVMDQGNVRYIKVHGYGHGSAPEAQVFGINEPYTPPTVHEKFKDYDVNLTSQIKAKVSGSIYPLESCALQISNAGASKLFAEVAAHTKTALQMTLKDISGIHTEKSKQELLKNCRIEIIGN